MTKSSSQIDDIPDPMIYRAAARRRFEEQSSPTWKGRLWVRWKMFWYEPCDDPLVPHEERATFWLDKQR